jgi:hypothetical protein
METDSLFGEEPKLAATPAPEKTAPAAAPEAKVIAEPEKKIEAKPVTAAPVEPAASPTPANPFEEKAKEPKAAKPGVFAGLVKKLNPLAYLPKRQPANAVRPKTARTVVQGELSLEKVRVLRNELNDSDLEFVAVKPAIVAPSSGSILPSEARPPLRMWGRLASRGMAVTEAQTQ